MKARSGFPYVKNAATGPKNGPPKLGFQFEAPTWVALYVHTGNPKSRTRFRCARIELLLEPLSSITIEINLQTNKIFSIRHCLHQHFLTKIAVDTRVLGLLNLSLAGIQDKAVLLCSRAIFLALWRSLRLSYLLELISCPFLRFQIHIPFTTRILSHLNSQQNPADMPKRPPIHNEKQINT